MQKNAHLVDLEKNAENTCLIAKIGVDATENEPEVLHVELSINDTCTPYFQPRRPSGRSAPVSPGAAARRSRPRAPAVERKRFDIILEGRFSKAGLV